MANPNEAHWIATKRLLRYLKGTIELGIYYERGGNTSIIAYTNSDFAENSDDRKSTSRSLFFLGSGAIS